MATEAAGAGPLDVRGVPADDFLSIEQHALDPIPLADRHGTPGGLFLLWAAAQANFTSIFTGALLIAALKLNGIALGTGDAIVAIVIGGVLAAVVLGLLSVIGPHTGTSQVVASRATFGMRGAALGGLFTLFLAIGWFAVDSVIGTQALIALLGKAGVSNSKPLEAILLLLIVGASMVVAVYGHQTISVFERFGAIVFVAFAALVFVWLVPKIDFGAAAQIHGADHAGAFILGASVVFALIASWYGFASDYSRYLSPSAERRRVTLFAGGGIAASTILLSILGVLLLTIDPNRDPNGLQDTIVNALPGVIGIPFLLYVAIGMVWGNYFDVYTAGLSSLAIGLPLSRWRAALVCGVLGGVLAYIALFQSDFQTQYTNFLLLTYVWAPGWAAVVLADFFFVRKRIEPTDLVRRGPRYWFSAGFSPTALLAWAIGTAAATPFINSPLWTSPLSKHQLHGADLSGVVAFVVAGVVYLAAARRGQVAAGSGAEAVGSDA
ncbi:MAG TPA: cytosine permease [Dehalococcoidia bacterium]|nr:cytosine permease [Dehalococcoidia bacterium]